MKKNQRGATLVEGAIVIPIWILIFMALADLYFITSTYMNLNSIVKEGLYLGALIDDQRLCYTAKSSSGVYVCTNVVANPVNSCFVGSSDGKESNPKSLDTKCPSSTSPSSTQISYRNRASVNSAAVSCSTASLPTPGCGNWILIDKMFLLADANKINSVGNRPGLSSYFFVTRRGGTTIEFPDSLTPGAVPGAPSTRGGRVNFTIPTLSISASGQYHGLFRIFNGITISATTQGPYSNGLMPAEDVLIS